MKTYVADAVTFLYYLFDKLPINSDKAFREAELGEAVIYLPTIAAAELFYLFDSRKWSEKQVEMRTVMEETLSFLYYPFNKEVLLESKRTKARHIHDKIMIATTNILKAEALLTKDKEIRKLGEVKTIW